SLFFTHPTTTHFYTLSLHDALPISTPCSATSSGSPPTRSSPVASPSRSPAPSSWRRRRTTDDKILPQGRHRARRPRGRPLRADPDRKSTRLNSSHVAISYAVFCLKK